MAHHRRTHPHDVPGCFGCHVLSVGFAAAAMPNRYPEPVRVEAKEQVLRKDLDAYKRLRHDGLQPKKIDGSAEVEKRVESQHDIDLGRYVPRHEEQRVREAMEWGREMREQGAFG